MNQGIVTLSEIWYFSTNKTIYEIKKKKPQMIDWVSIVRHSRRRFSNYAPNLRRLRPPKNPSSHKTEKEHRNKYHHNNHHHNNCSSTQNSPTDSETRKSNALSCCYCHVWKFYFIFFFIKETFKRLEIGATCISLEKKNKRFFIIIILCVCLSLSLEKSFCFLFFIYYFVEKLSKKNVE